MATHNQGVIAAGVAVVNVFFQSNATVVSAMWQANAKTKLTSELADPTPWDGSYTECAS